eukprot:9191196-Lingulodinium_polyedra.AAC.1
MMRSNRRSSSQRLANRTVARSMRREVKLVCAWRARARGLRTAAATQRGFTRNLAQRFANAPQ